ncbi:MAG: GNAT family N-acetyltransferase [Chloroflexi bacterium]|nr:GNAT family N-acetyltransferase [Chloroflexota bacterium]
MESRRQRWLDVWAEAGGERLFLHPEWVTTWFRHLGRIDYARGLMVGEHDETLGLAVLSREPLLPFGKGVAGSFVSLRTPGAGVSDYQDLLLRDAEQARTVATARLLDWLLEAPDWHILDLPNLPAESPTVAALWSAAAQRGLPRWRLPTYPRPYLPFRDADGQAVSWETFLAGRDSLLRYKLRSRLKRLSKQGTVTFDEVGEPEAVVGLLPVLTAIHARRWTGRRTSAVFSSSERGRAFYAEAFPAMARTGMLRIATLTLDGRLIAGIITFRDRGRAYYYVPTFDPDFSQFAPGQLLLARLAENACRDGMERLDLMLGDERYKQEWTNRSEDCVRLAIARPGPEGRVALAALGGYQRLREAARQSMLLQTARQRGLRAALETARSRLSPRPR